MRWRNLAALLGMAAMSVSINAVAQESDRGLYLGLGLEQFKLNVSGTDNGNDFRATTRPLGFTARLGYNLFSWLSAEAKGSVGIHDDPNEGVIGSGQTIRNGETELKHLFGAAIKPQFQHRFADTATFTFYGLVGYADFELEGGLSDDNQTGPPGTIQTADFTVDDNSVYYGGGLQLDGETASFVLQYLFYYDDETNGNEAELDAVHIGVNAYF